MNRNITPYQRAMIVEMINDYFHRSRNRLLYEDNEGYDGNFNDGRHSKKYVIKKNTPQFGDIRAAQEDLLLKTIGERVTLADDALVFYPGDRPGDEDITLEGHIAALDVDFQFRYNDNRGDGCYIWAKETQLSDENLRKIGKIKDAFDNWKESFTKNGDLLDKLKQMADKENEQSGYEN